MYNFLVIQSNVAITPKVLGGSSHEIDLPLVSVVLTSLAAYPV